MIMSDRTAEETLDMRGPVSRDAAPRRRLPGIAIAPEH